MSTEPLTLPRTVWEYLLALSKQHVDMGTAERLMAVAITENDYTTNHFLGLRLKMQEGVLRGIEDESLQALAETGESTKEASVTIDLAVGELQALDMCMEMASWQGAIATQHEIWKGIRSLVERARREKDMG